MIPKPCLGCGELVFNVSRCENCQSFYNHLHPKKPRPHYQVDYRRRAKEVRDNAVACWICGEGARSNDPWTADHVIPANPDSLLLAAHRSCNSRRGNRLK